MGNSFYSKLALMNIKKNSKTYFPFLITCICTITMFYIIHTISINPGLEKTMGAQALKAILNLGTIVIAIFSAIFLFYTNSFLMKRRKKEIGLYNVLGLDKSHISKVLFLETVIIFLVSVAIGLLGGIILNKLMFLLLLRLLHFEVYFGFSISLPSIIKTLTLFTGIFTLMLLFNLLQIRLLKPIDLLKGPQQGEKEPKTKWLMAIIGVLTLGSGYGLALRVQSPLTAINFFFIAVILVMMGTYSLFTAGSVLLLKLLRKNNRFYYKTTNFISISGMLYRMKQNAVGLSNICILSTAVLVMLSTTISLYVGLEDTLRYRYPRDITINVSEITEIEVQKIEDIVDTEIRENQIQTKNRLSYWHNSFVAIKEGERFSSKDEILNQSGMSLIVAIPISDYNRIEGQNITLKDNEVLIYTAKGQYGKESMIIQDKTFQVKAELDTLQMVSQEAMALIDTYLVFVNDIDGFVKNEKRSYFLGLDVEGGEEEALFLYNRLKEKLRENNLSVYIESADQNRGDFIAIHGGLLFLGIFLGTLFLMAMVLIIYYKQISEGYDDKGRFEIMQKVGMSKDEIKKIIRKQVLLVFFLPLVTAVVHIAFAFPMITKLLAVLNLTNVSLFMMATIATILVFAAIYLIVYSLTAKTYYNIVEKV